MNTVCGGGRSALIDSPCGGNGRQLYSLDLNDVINKS